MAQPSDEELKTIALELIDRTDDSYEWSPGDTEAHDFLALLYYIRTKFYEAVGDQDAGNISAYRDPPEEWSHTLKYLIEFFLPGYLVPQTLKIAPDMEAMGYTAGYKKDEIFITVQIEDSSTEKGKREDPRPFGNY